MTIADSPIAAQIDSGGTYCASAGNVGSKNQLTPQKTHIASKAHLNIVYLRMLYH